MESLLDGYLVEIDTTLKGMKQMNKTKTWVVNARVDIRSLASLAKFYEAQGNKTKKKSTYIRLAVEHFTQMVVDKYPEFITPTFHEAVAYLEEIRLLDLEDDFANKYTLAKALQDEGFKAEERIAAKSDIPITPEADEAIRLLNEKLSQVKPIEE